jgi:Sulfatase
VIHSVLAASAYVLNTALANEITPSGYLRALVGAAVLAGCLTIVGWALFRNRWDGALFATAFILLAVSPVSLGWVLVSLRGALGQSLGTFVTGGILIAGLGAIGVRILQLRRRGKRLPRPPAEAMNVFSVALLGVVVASHGLGFAAEPAASSVPPPSGWDVGEGPRPDIVVLLLDGYPRSDVLERRLRTNNSSFLNSLAERGFDVATTNHSNYPRTGFTLASIFQMRYLDEVPSLQPFVGTNRQANEALRSAAESGQAFSILRAAGYEVTTVASGWDQVTFRDASDRLLDSGELNDLERYAVHRTLLVYLLDLVWPHIFTAAQRDRVVHGFDFLDTIASEAPKGPRFVLVHIPAPHLPLVVTADGTPTDLTASRYETATREGYGMTDSDYAAAWQSEIDYLDARVLRSIDLLLGSEAGRQAIIIVMSDHGYGFEPVPGDIQAKLANLFAARTPSAPGLLAGAPTPVNWFRILFNEYLGTELPLLQDRYFVQVQPGRQLDLIEVEDPDQIAEPGQ